MSRFLYVMFLFVCFVGQAQEKPTVIATDSENDLIPEGIAVNPRTGTIYVSSIAHHKIIAVDANGNCKDFIHSGEHGFLEGLGMKVDSKRNLLWALSDKREGKLFTSQVYAFDLTSSKLIQSYSLKDTIPHLFNDLDIDEQGTIYLTDTYYSAVYFIDTRTKKLDLFLKNALTKYPNGIALGEGNELYIATYENGLVQIDLTTKIASRVTGINDSTMSHGLDGIVFTNNQLIGVYNYDNKAPNGVTPGAIIKYSLNEKGDVLKEEIIDNGNPYFFEPTTLSLAGKKLYVVANSHIAAYNANKESTKGIEGQLKPLTILRYQLQ
jgi:sugar lactone lactonase YvrE